MASKQCLTGTAGVILVLAAMTGAAQSASPGSMLTDFGRATATASDVERAQYRICAMEGGVRRCRTASISGPYRGRRVYGYQATGRVYGYQAIPRQYGYESPDQYPVGSGAWWQSMDLLGRGGNGSD